MILCMIFYQAIVFLRKQNDCWYSSATEVLSKLYIPKLSIKEFQFCEGTITKDEVLETLKELKVNRMDFLRNSKKRSGIV